MSAHECLNFLTVFAGENTKPNHNVKELVIQPDDALSHGTLFRSPFDPRSEEDLVSSTCGGNENGVASGFGRHRRRNRRGCPEDGSGPESSFNDVKLSTGFGRRLREHWDGKGRSANSFYHNLSWTPNIVILKCDGRSLLCDRKHQKHSVT